MSKKKFVDCKNCGYFVDGNCHLNPPVFIRFDPEVGAVWEFPIVEKSFDFCAQGIHNDDIDWGE